MTLRDTLEEAVNTAEAGQTEQVTPVVQTPVVPVETKAEPVETEEQKAGRTAGRSRDEHGRLLPGKAEKPAQVAGTTQAKSTETASDWRKNERNEWTNFSPTAAKIDIAPPGSWTKDNLDAWEKLALEHPSLARQIVQREGEFAKGVSTYKQEYENVKPLAEAMQQFIPTLQQYGIQPSQWITNMGNAHHALVFGNSQQKLQMFAKLAQDYGVPLQALYDPQAQQQFLMQQTITPPAPQQDVRALVQEQFTEMAAKTDLQQFEAAKDGAGNPLYPHYQTVRNTMAQLLEANLAQDLKSAYDKAIRMHDDIWEKEQAVKQAASQQSAQLAQAKQVSKAKAAAVSPKTATPGVGTTQTTKGIRSALEAAVEAHSEGGRV